MEAAPGGPGHGRASEAPWLVGPGPLLGGAGRPALEVGGAGPRSLVPGHQGSLNRALTIAYTEDHGDSGESLTQLTSPAQLACGFLSH